MLTCPPWVHSQACAHPSGLCPPQSPAYTLVWTRQNHGTLPAGAVDFNGILTLRGVRPQDAGVYVCTGSNMLDMDQGTATLYVQGEPGRCGHPGVTGVTESTRGTGTHGAEGTSVVVAFGTQILGLMGTRDVWMWMPRCQGDGHIQCLGTRVMALLGAQSFR